MHWAVRHKNGTLITTFLSVLRFRHPGVSDSKPSTCHISVLACNNTGIIHLSTTTDMYCKCMTSTRAACFLLLAHLVASIHINSNAELPEGYSTVSLDALWFLIEEGRMLWFSLIAGLNDLQLSCTYSPKHLRQEKEHKAHSKSRRFHNFFIYSLIMMCRNVVASNGSPE